MFKVQLRDANQPDKVLVGTMHLPFDPRDHKELRVRRRPNDLNHTSYRVVDHIYEVITESPGESGIVVLVTKIG